MTNLSNKDDDWNQLQSKVMIAEMRSGELEANNVFLQMKLKIVSKQIKEFEEKMKSEPNVDIRNITSKLNKDIESFKIKLIEKELDLEKSEQKLLESSNLLNREIEKRQYLESQVNDLQVLSEKLKNERDIALKELEAKRLFVINNRKHQYINLNDSQVTLNDFQNDDDNEEVQNLESTFCETESMENYSELDKLHQSNKDLTEKITKLQTEVENSTKLERIISKEREVLLSHNKKLQEELKDAIQREATLQKNNDEILQQLNILQCDIERSANNEKDRIIRAVVTDASLSDFSRFFQPLRTTSTATLALLLATATLLLATATSATATSATSLAG